MNFIYYDIEFKTYEEDGSWKIRHRIVLATSIDFALKQFDILEGYKYSRYELISVHIVKDQ